MKKVLITGGATGIGKACAVKFKENGYEVFITYNKTRPDFDGVTAIKCNLESVDEICNLFSNSFTIFSILFGEQSSTIVTTKVLLD